MDFLSQNTANASYTREQRWLLGLLVFAFVVRLTTLGAYPLMDNTEARYAELARKMVETWDWVTPQVRYGVPWWSKPPLSIWLTAVSYLALGVNEFTARLPSFLVSIAAAWLTFDLAARRNGRSTAFQAVVVLFTTPLFFISAGAVMTDPALLLGTTLSMTGFWQAMTRSDRAGRVWGYVFFLGLAIGLMAKGPVAAVLTFGPVGLWTLWKGGIRAVWQRLPWIAGLILTCALAVPWYVVAEARTPGFLDYFLVGEHWKRYTESGWKGDRFGTAHSTTRGTIWLLAAATTLPWSAIWIGWSVKLRRAVERPPATDDDGWRAYLWLWMLTPLVFFTFAGNILFTYALPGLPAFAILVSETWTAARASIAARASLKLAALIVPIAIVLVVWFAIPIIAPRNSHKMLVAQYLGMRKSETQRLIYLREAPQSAEFYSHGKVVTAASPGELDPYLHDDRIDFVVLTEAQLDSLPGIRGQLTRVGSYGRYVLLQERSPNAAPPQ